MSKKNVVGAQVRRIRYEKGWTQETLTARCNLQGWDLSRGTLAKVEAQVRRVSDAELFVLAKALRTKLDSLYPRDEKQILDLVE